MRTAVVMSVLWMLSASPLCQAETHEERVAQVRAAEHAFAKTVADRDFDAFTAHLADDAVFFGANEAAAWQGCGHGGVEAILRWTASAVLVGA